MEEALWYVVHTYSGYENKVASNIETAAQNRRMTDLIQAVKIPVEKAIELKDGKKKEIERKVFPGYVLVKMVVTPDTWFVVRNIRGVTGFIGPTTEPIPLTDEEVKRLEIEERPPITVDYALGDTVRIIDGPFDRYIGLVDDINLEREKVRVIITMFGRETPVELELDQVEICE